jgi:hypothetical protein
MENPEKTKRGNQEWRIQRKPKGAIKNGESRDTGNMGYTRHKTKTNKRKNITQKTKKMSNTDPKKPGVKE